MKDALDKQFGARWHVVIGTDFAHSLTHEVRGRKAHAFTLMNWRLMSEVIAQKNNQTSLARRPRGFRIHVRAVQIPTARIHRRQIGSSCVEA